MGVMNEVFQRSPEQAHKEFCWLDKDEVFIEELVSLQGGARWIVSDRALYMLLPGAGVPARAMPWN